MLVLDMLDVGFAILTSEKFMYLCRKECEFNFEKLVLQLDIIDVFRSVPWNVY